MGLWPVRGYMVAFAIRAGWGVSGASALVSLGALATHTCTFEGAGIMCKFQAVCALSGFIYYKKGDTVKLIP